MTFKEKRDKFISLIDTHVKGKIEAAHDDMGHHYKFVSTGEIVDSVTTKNILHKEHLIPWAVKIGVTFLEEENRYERLSTPERDVLINAACLKYTDVRDDAGDVGTAAHNIIENYINDWILKYDRPQSIESYIPDSIDPRVVAAVRCASKAFDSANVTPIACELLVGVPGLSAGTLDLLVMNQRRELELWDWKTSNNIDIFYACQTSAYKEFFIDMMKKAGVRISIPKIKIIKLDKYSDRPKMYRVVNPKESYRIFKAISNIYDWKNSPQNVIEEDKVIVKI